MNTYAHWFRWIVVLGILRDWFFGLPGIFIANAVLDVAGAAPAVEPIWPAFALLILVLLTLFYLTAAMDPFHYLPNAVLAVVARAAGVAFFFVLYPGRFPPLFGTIDLVLAVLLGVLLLLALRKGPATEAT